MKTTVHLNIGSNVGDRRATIARAVADIAASFPAATIRCSSAVTSAPWGYDSAAEYVNVGVELTMDRTSPWTAADLEQLLDALQAIERRHGTLAHRNADGTYRDRDLDIDIIAVDMLCLDTPRLTIPHPRAAVRDFVMTPLRELAPDMARRIQSCKK